MKMGAIDEGSRSLAIALNASGEKVDSNEDGASLHLAEKDGPAMF